MERTPPKVGTKVTVNGTVGTFAGLNDKIPGDWWIEFPGTGAWSYDPSNVEVPTFEVSYALKPYGTYSITVTAADKAEARRTADGLFRQMERTAKVKNVKVREVKQ